MQRPVIFVMLLCIAGVVCAQQFQLPHPITRDTIPPAQPPIVLNPPPPPADRLDLKTGEGQPSKLCVREVFAPCPDEHGKNCFRKETYRCD